MTFNKVQWSCGGFCGFCVQALCECFDPQPWPQRPQSSGGIFISTPALVWSGGQAPERGDKNGSNFPLLGLSFSIYQIGMMISSPFESCLESKGWTKEEDKFPGGVSEVSRGEWTLMKLERAGKEAQEPWIPFLCMLWGMELFLVPGLLRSRMQEIKTWK